MHLSLSLKPDPVQAVQEKIQAAKEVFIEARKGMQHHLTTEVISTIKEGELQESFALVV